MQISIILENSKGHLSLFYPEETLTASQQNNGLFPKYGIRDTNIFTSMQFIQHKLKTESAALFKYSLRERPDASIYNSNLGLSKIDRTIPNFNFELNVFNLVKLSNNYTILLKTGQKPMLYHKGPEYPKDNE
jgi:hypothetical protein